MFAIYLDNVNQSKNEEQPGKSGEIAGGAGTRSYFSTIFCFDTGSIQELMYRS